MKMWFHVYMFKVNDISEEVYLNREALPTTDGVFGIKFLLRCYFIPYPLSENNNNIGEIIMFSTRTQERKKNEIKYLNVSSLLRCIPLGHCIVIHNAWFFSPGNYRRHTSSYPKICQWK